MIGGATNASSVSAQEEAAQEGARFQKKNENSQRQKGPQKEKTERQKKINCIKTIKVVFSFILSCYPAIGMIYFYRGYC